MEVEHATHARCMDVACPRCGEAVDIAELQDRSGHRTIDECLAALLREGCGALFGGQCAADGTARTSTADFLWEVAGNDPDSLAVACSDLLDGE